MENEQWCLVDRGSAARQRQRSRESKYSNNSNGAPGTPSLASSDAAKEEDPSNQQRGDNIRRAVGDQRDEVACRGEEMNAWNECRCDDFPNLPMIAPTEVP